jgi:two-component system cell cycle response regulator
MQRDPHVTLKFPKIVPIEAPSSPSVGPEWSEDCDDEVPTLPGIPGTHLDTVPRASTSARDRAVLTAMSGLDAGRVFSLDLAETVIGRARDAAAQVSDTSVSRRHARILRVQARRYTVEDVGSTNGVFVNGKKVQRAELCDGDRVQIGTALVFRFDFLAADEEAVARQLYEGSTKDALTRVYNRKHASERLTAEVAYANRHGTPLCMVMFDIDHFKRINDGFGHPAGDGVLRVVAAQIQKTIQAEDLLARYGGEEFIVLARGIQHSNGSVLAERIRKGVERLAIPWSSRTLRATVSIGVASISECQQRTVEALVALADKRLYRAKGAGRNRVCAK